MKFDKIKKIFSFVIIMLVTLCIVGCADANTSVGVARNLENSANKLDSIVSKLEEVDYDDIVIGELSPFSNTENVQSTKTSALKKTKTYTVGNYATQKTSQEKPRDATFVSAKKSKIDVPRTEKRFENSKALRNVTRKYDCEDGTCEPINNANQSRNMVSTNQRTRNANGNQYTARRTSNYRPRFVNEMSENFSRDTLDRYLDSIELLYDDCADCISCNAECKNECSKLSQNLSECKILCQKLNDGTIKLSESEILECNSKIDSLKNYMSRLNSTKGNILAKCKDISKNKNNFSSNVDILQSSYEKLFSALESRLDCLQQCNSCINEICNIINRTNVDMREAEKNKSDTDDIIYDKEKILEEQEYNPDNYLTKPAEKNNTVQNISKKTQKTNKTNRNTNDKNNMKRSTQTRRSEKINTRNINQNNKKTTLNNTQPKNISQNRTRNTTNRTVKNDNQSNINSQENNVVNENQRLSNENTEIPNQTAQQNNLPEVNSNNTMPNNPQTNQNMANNPYGYGYNGPYQNGTYPYPPRNIDTYRNINKNIDTYAPNYIPQTNTNVLNNQTQSIPFNDMNNQTKENAQTDTQSNNQNDTTNNLETDNANNENSNLQNTQTTENNLNVDVNNETNNQNTGAMQNNENNNLSSHNTTENTDKNGNDAKFEGSFPVEEVKHF